MPQVYEHSVVIVAIATNASVYIVSSGLQIMIIRNYEIPRGLRLVYCKMLDSLIWIHHFYCRDKGKDEFMLPVVHMFCFC